MPLPPHNPKRRDILKLLGGSALAFPRAARADRAITTVSIIHTTDLHGHVLPTSSYEGLNELGGLARCASLIRQWRQQNPNSLLLDVGDVYQGTRTSQRNGGALMIKLFNKLNYDSWTLGNHEFDWGIEPLQRAIADSEMPVLTANVELEGRKPGTLTDPLSPLSKISPYLIKEVGGFKIGVIGAITPGLPFWLRPEMTRGIEAIDPIGPIKEAARALRLRGADAIVVTGHMGHRYGRDDFANRVSDVTTNCPDIDVFIGGHTHIDVPNYRANGALYTQAGYHGIYLGRVDLAFSMDSHRLVDKRSFTVMMDGRFDLDPVVIATASSEIEAAKTELAKPVGVLERPLSSKSAPGKPSDVQRLHAVAIRDSLARKQVVVDAVLHGQFVKEDVPAGEKRLADMWQLAPYENLIVTADLTREQLIIIAQETCNAENARNLIGLDLVFDGGRVSEINAANGQPLDPQRRYKIALNSYDSQSGGKRFLKLLEIMAEPATSSTFHPQETRDALIELFLERGTIDPNQLSFT